MSARGAGPAGMAGTAGADASAVPTVVALDDDRPFLDSVCFLLEGLGYAAHGFADAAAALRALERVPPERPVCALLDVRMPRVSGLDVHDAINARLPHLPVVYMTGHGDVPLAVEAMGKGAVTFLEKPLDDERLERALELAFDPVRQRRRVPAGRAASLAEVRRLHAALSARERAVLDAVRGGLSSREIAERLSVTPKNVEFHRSKLLHRFGERSSAALLRRIDEALDA